MNDDRGIVWVCPNCFHVMGQKKINIPKGTPAWKVYKPLTPDCPKCNRTMFWCDDTIADHIVALNRMGFYTRSCCGGHAGSSIAGVWFKSMPPSRKRVIKNAYDHIITEYPKFSVVDLNTFKFDPMAVAPQRMVRCSFDTLVCEIELSVFTDKKTLESHPNKGMEKIMLFRDFLSVLCEYLLQRR